MPCKVRDGAALPASGDRDVLCHVITHIGTSQGSARVWEVKVNQQGTGAHVEKTSAD